VDPREQFHSLLAGHQPLLALAPMQGVTDLRFLKLMAAYGGADVYFTEYFRVYPTSRLNKHVLKCITENPTGRPIVAQMIGHDIPALVRTARELQRYPVAAVDLNLGCPAPIVCRKDAGGGLLRDPARVDAILGALRDAVRIPLTVKTRIGFDSPAVFSELLPIFAKHSLDLLTVHARTVKEMYRSKVHYDFIARAVAGLRCPMLANGNVYSAPKAAEVLKITGARRAHDRTRRRFAIPGCSDKSGSISRANPSSSPAGLMCLAYVRALHEAVCSPAAREAAQVQKMKKYMNYLGVGVERPGNSSTRSARHNHRRPVRRV